MKFDANGTQTQKTELEYFLANFSNNLQNKINQISRDYDKAKDSISDYLIILHAAKLAAFIDIQECLKESIKCLIK